MAWNQEENRRLQQLRCEQGVKGWVGWVGWLGARLSRGPPHPRPLAPFRIARLQLEARDQELRQAEDQAQRAREKQAWVQLKEQEVLQLQVGQGHGELGIGDSGERSTGSLLAPHKEGVFALAGDSHIRYTHN